MEFWPLVSLLLLICISSSLSARIAGFHAVGGSQYINIRNALEELASRGHEVLMVAPSSQKVNPSEKVPHKIYQVSLYKPGFVENILVPLELEGTKLQYMFKMSEVLADSCEAVLNNTEVLDALKGFDMIVYDTLGMCAALVGELLGIPRVEIYPIAPSFTLSVIHMIPIPVSYVPMIVLPFSDRMTFLERVINCGAYLGAQLLMNVKFAGKMNVLKTKYNIKPERSFQEALRDTELVIITGDFALEYPQPLLPGNVMVGPLNVRDTDGRALPPDLEAFISNSGGHGFVIVSFGSNLASVLPRSVVDMLATAFGKLKQRVLWRLKGYIPSFLASNIKVMEWLPQNELLGHMDIKAFVSHVGHNSLYESAYHGVPVVAFPLFADQHGNAKKAEHFGLGLSVNYKSTDAQQLFETLELVINEPRFKAKAMHISDLLKDRRRTSLQETCDWIEYVLRHGGARHLRPQVFNIPWYQYYLLDVMAFLVAIVALVVMVIWMACRCLCNLCCKKSAGSKPKKE